MPEGPEIRRAADRISKVLIGEEIIESNFYYERIKEKEEIVKNQNIKDITTRGKAMIIRFKNDWSMYSHNKSCGRWTVNLIQQKSNQEELLE